VLVVPGDVFSSFSFFFLVEVAPVGEFAVIKERDGGVLFELLADLLDEGGELFEESGCLLGWR
jgi:hypothetical protein